MRQLPRALNQRRNDLASVLEAAGALHVRDGVALHLHIRRLLLEDVDELQVGRVGADAVDDGKRKLALGQVLAHALVVRVLARGEVHVVVADLEDEADEVDEGHAVEGRAARALGLHELDAQAEEPARLVAHHFEVVVLGGAGEGVAPKEVHALPAVQVDELVGKRGQDALVVELEQLLQRDKVDVVGRVDGLRDAKDVVRHGEPPTQLRRVLHVVHQQRRLVQHPHHPRDDLEAVRRHFEEHVERGDEL